MPTHIDMHCPRCHYIQEIIKKLGENPKVLCPACGELMRVHFGSLGGVPINYGFRPHRYSNKTDRDIGQFQFKNL